MGSSRRRRRCVRLSLAAAGLVACAPLGSDAQDGPDRLPAAADCVYVENGYGPAGAVPVRAEEIARGLEVPWGIAFLPGGGMLVTERPGRIRLVDAAGKLQDASVAEVDIAARGEGGLLGIALHPDFAANRSFFVYATVDADGGAENRVLRYVLAEDARTAKLDGVVYSGIPAARFHNGGRLRIGPDGMLWIGTGDAGEPDNARDPSSPAGKLLRIDPGGGIPPRNPWEGEAAWLIGIRNVQAFDWAEDGTLGVADHGPSGEFGLRGHDEVTFAERGADLGWPVIYGCGEAEGMRSPAISWNEAVPPGGAAFYRGKEFPEWRGGFVVGTLGSRHLHVVQWDAATRRLSTHSVYFEGDPPEGLGRIRDVISGPDRELYVTTSNCDGRGTCPGTGDKVFRLVRARAR